MACWVKKSKGIFADVAAAGGHAFAVFAHVSIYTKSIQDCMLIVKWERNLLVCFVLFRFMSREGRKENVRCPTVGHGDGV